jgi:hypothetical protein
MEFHVLTKDHLHFILLDLVDETVSLLLFFYRMKMMVKAKKKYHMKRNRRPPMDKYAVRVCGRATAPTVSYEEQNMVRV